MQLNEGDYGKRPADAAKQYHGFGFWQIDIASFPSFISSGKWVDPGAMAQPAVTAAYNCGEGNVNKALEANLDVDSYTFAKDYSKEVFRYRGIYQNL